MNGCPNRRFVEGSIDGPPGTASNPLVYTTGSASWPTRRAAPTRGRRSANPATALFRASEIPTPLREFCVASASPVRFHQLEMTPYHPKSVGQHAGVDLYEALYTTRAMRRVRPDPIPMEVQSRIMDAAIRAPSGGNVQGWRFLLVDDPELRGKLAALYRDAFQQLMDTRYSDAAATIAARPDDPENVLLERMLRSGRYLADNFQEVPLVMFAFQRGDVTGLSLYPAVWSAMLAARADGVGSALTSVLTMFAAEETSRLLDVPEDDGWTQRCAVTFGYPLGPWGRAERKSLTEVTYRNRWGTDSALHAGPYWPG
jgi:nitroreductase